MTSLRSRLSWLLAGWLVVHSAALVAPVVLFATGHATEDVCTCPGAEHGATCPMHHSTQPTPGSRTKCTLQNAHAPLDTALLSLFASHGVVPQKMSVDLTETAFQRILPVVSELASRTDLPDAPPPRA